MANRDGRESSARSQVLGTAERCYRAGVGGLTDAELATLARFDAGAVVRAARRKIEKRFPGVLTMTRDRIFEMAEACFRAGRRRMMVTELAELAGVGQPIVSRARNQIDELCPGLLIPRRVTPPVTRRG